MQIKTVNRYTVVSFSILAILMLFSVSIAIYYRNIQIDTLNMQRETLVQSYRLKSGSEKLTNAVRSFLATGDTVYYDEYIKEAKVTRSTDKAVDSLRKLSVTPREFELIKEAKHISDNLINTEIQAFDAGRSGKMELARKLVYGEYYQNSINKIMNPIQKFQNQIENRLSSEVMQSNRYADASMIIAFLMIGITTIAIVIVQFLFYGKKVVLPLIDLNTRVKQLINQKEEKECGQTIDLSDFDTQNEIGSLATSIMDFHKVVVQANQEQQLRQRISEIIIKLRETEDFLSLAKTFMLNIKELLGILHGLFYVADDRKKTLRLIGGYGVSGEDIDRKIAFGVGLAGQCAIEKQMIRLDNPPADYVPIVSGTGYAAPACILIIPLILNSRVVGVLELSAFKQFNDKDLAILAEIEPILATHIETTSYKTGYFESRQNRRSH